VTAAVAALAAIFAQLSLLAVGGVNTVLPEMQRQVVQVHGWMKPGEFAALFALAQAAPGPNMLVSTLVGWRVAGLPGALVATFSLCGPSSLLTFITAGAWHRFRHAPWRGIIQRGLVPVTVGLVMAAAVLLTEATSASWGKAAITAVTTVALLTSRLHPLVLLGAGAALGAAGVLG
jgi:chromate transporter